MIGIMLKKGILDKETAEKYAGNLGEETVYFESYDELDRFERKNEIDVLMNLFDFKGKVIESMPSLKWIMSYSAGVDIYDFDVLEKQGIILTNTSGLHKTNIAEQTFGALIMFSRNILQATYNKSEGVWAQYHLGELINRNILIIGAGNIGQEIARKAKAFDMNTFGVRAGKNSKPVEYFDEVYSKDDLDSVIPGKDYVIMVVPSTEETRGMFGKKQFELMERTAVFVNVGRGDTVDEDALIETLTERKIRGAYCDVFRKEPLPSDSPLWKLKNMIITPHNAGPTPYYAERAFDIMKDNLKRFRAGSPLKNVIDPVKKY